MQQLGTFIRSLIITVSSIILPEILAKPTPTKIKEEMERLDPAGNRDSSSRQWIEPLRQWHGSRLKMNMKLFVKLLTKKDVCANYFLKSLLQISYRAEKAMLTPICV